MAALSLERLRLLHAVAARGTIAAAARDAGYTASAVSQQLSALERELADVAEQAGALKTRWTAEKESIGALRATKSELEGLTHEIEAAERAGVVTMVPFTYRFMPTNRYVKELVDEAAVVSGTASQYEAELKQLEREAQSNRALYESFLNRFKELREQQDIQRADARILAYAWPSGSPSSPNYKTGLFGAFIVGCLLGMAGAIAAEKLDRVFRSASQVEKATGVAVLGMVPLVKGAVGQRSSIVTQVLDKTTSSAAEAMRAVFTAISLSNLDRPPRVIAVTSSTPGEGKTTFAAALGGLLTKMNASRRVLLMARDRLRVIADVWSSDDGTYRFERLNEDQAYIVMALDHQGLYEPVAYDFVRPASIRDGSDAEPDSGAGDG